MFRVSRFLSEERIFHFFRPYGSGISVPRIYDGVVGQYEQTAAYMFSQFVEIAAFQVGTSDASVKEDIAAERTFLCLAVINDAAGRVSRYVNGFKFCVSKAYDVAIAYLFTQRNGRFVDFKTEQAALFGHFI